MSQIRNMKVTNMTTSTERIALITGANVGIGRVTAIELAKAGYLVIIAGRSLARTQPILDDIQA
jgi:NADP-dependent 3-hydroxy acid dehydrogenase YdfG